ncbi:group 1 truncated hemoglobin [Gordonia sp. ABSL11-1]|uniref:group I truncated hemoglobin n=1 Tax=Gordonia sp. ABSL11-1 TaxID=3053924 RepID=UPI002573D28D|nr:group 1 truncated hemoglobin [Gordonia sp. ABSL11-1]MDL9948935.1 group 1 truncated hemoglobin [Gordonia sp. ABSL11-1]
MTEQASLYDRLGGLESVAFLARTLVIRAMLNPTIGHIWNHKTEAEVQEEISGFVDFLGMHWGGPQTYHGPDMATAHRGMGITEEYWDALFEDIVTPAFAEFGIPQQEADEIDAFLRSFKSVVVGSPSFKDVVKSHPDMDVMQGMRSVGINWPAPASA